MEKTFSSKDLMRMRNAFRNSPYYLAVDDFGCFEGEDNLSEDILLFKNGTMVSFKISNLNGLIPLHKSYFEVSLKPFLNDTDGLNLQISWEIPDFEDSLSSRESISPEFFVPSGDVSFHVDSVDEAIGLLNTFYRPSTLEGFKKKILDSDIPLLLSRRTDLSVADVKRSFSFYGSGVEPLVANCSLNGCSPRGKDLRASIKLIYRDDGYLLVFYEETEEMDSGFRSSRKAECSRYLEISELREFFNSKTLEDIVS